METLGKHFPTERNKLGWPSVGRGRTGTEGDTSQATDAQPRRAVRLAESWQVGRGATLTEDVAAGQGRLICIV